MRSTAPIITAALALSAALCGCARPHWLISPAPDAIPADAAVDLRHFLFPTTEGMGVRRVFHRYPQGDESGTFVTYEQVITNDHRADGMLARMPVFPLTTYLRAGAPRTTPLFPWPKPEDRSAAALFVEFDPPLVEWPATLHRDMPVDMEATATLFGARGQKVVDGKVRRTLWFEGYEGVEVIDRTYARALRVRAETELTVAPWYAGTLRETAWFVDGVGLVRRTEQLAGRVLLFRVSASYEYLLDSSSVKFIAGSSCGSGSPRLWKRAAVFLKCQWPRPQLGGLRVEWESCAPSGADRSGQVPRVSVR